MFYYWSVTVPGITSSKISSKITNTILSQNVTNYSYYLLYGLHPLTTWWQHHHIRIPPCHPHLLYQRLDLLMQHMQVLYLKLYYHGVLIIGHTNIGTVATIGGVLAVSVIYSIIVTVVLIVTCIITKEGKWVVYLIVVQSNLVMWALWNEGTSLAVVSITI